MLSHVGTDSRHFLLQRLDLPERIALGFGFTCELLLQFGALPVKLAHFIPQLIGRGQCRVPLDDDVIVHSLQFCQVGFQGLAVRAEDLFPLLHGCHPESAHRIRDHWREVGAQSIGLGALVLPQL
ncbi:hypothetical protein ALSL_0533 [Aerosticca soli]|uniref:Uncharacterized protein n=1 Tax=Aerosticca soli TaxID=2010829 RepID=A0A2Z6E2B0_9GAMM|nr:hypothetical protein ALSL_0533 [Aerosticca soli]